jgi:predicted RNA binding protein YcfA (HicA-like mRNA interferase family)
VTKLPAVSGRECLRVLQKAGFVLKRQEGSHMILRRDDPFCQVVVPDHKYQVTAVIAPPVEGKDKIFPSERLLLSGSI